MSHSTSRNARSLQSRSSKLSKLSSTSLILKHNIHSISSSHRHPLHKKNKIHICNDHCIHSLQSRNFGKFHNKNTTNNHHHHIHHHNINANRSFAANAKPQDYYDTLGVGRDAKDAEIKKAFYKLAKQWHPDANKAPEAKDKFSEINEAYQCLSNKDKRANYDRFGTADGMGQGMGGAGFNPQDINLNDLFENLFGGGGGRGGGGASGFPFGDMFGGGNAQSESHADPLAPERGRDLQVDVPLSFMEAVNGSARELKIQRFDECVSCGSSGVESGTKPTKCGTCDGKGRMVQQSGFMVIQQTCWDCNGSGQKCVNCGVCQGSGLKSNVTSLDVNIPAGVDDGTRVRIANQGHTGKNHGGRGHCWLLCRVKSDERFERNGSDVHVAIDVPVYKAVLGGTVTVPTLNGEAEVKVKAGTQPEHREIMRGKGITEPSTGRKGHQYLHFNVVVPADITSEQRELMEKFGEIQEAREQSKK